MLQTFSVRRIPFLFVTGHRLESLPEAFLGGSPVFKRFWVSKNTISESERKDFWVVSAMGSEAELVDTGASKSASSTLGRLQRDEVLFAVEHQKRMLDHAPWFNRLEDRVLVERAAGVEIELHQCRVGLVPDVDSDVRRLNNGNAGEPTVAGLFDVGDMRPRQDVHALAFDKLRHPVHEVIAAEAQRRVGDFETSDEVVVFDHGYPHDGERPGWSPQQTVLTANNSKRGLSVISFLS
jgi:hypothetical protein